jgi:hypothetical protein
VLESDFGKKQTRLWVSVDWEKIKDHDDLSGQIIFTDGKKKIGVEIQALKTIPELKTFNGFIEHNGLVSMHASHYSGKNVKGNVRWQVVTNLGHTGETIMATPVKSIAEIGYDSVASNTSSYVEYEFYTFTECNPEIQIYTLPTHPINKSFSMRYAVSVDSGPTEMLDFKTFGRSDEWKQNVLRNSAIKTFRSNFLSKGRHTLKIYAIDPGVILDRIIINLNSTHKAYSLIPETRRVAH